MFFMSIAENINKIKSQIPPQVTLVAVSKTHTVESILAAYNAGQRIFGENKVQELLSKYESLKKHNIEWHLIGHLQTNKVKDIAPFISLIQSVDSLKLLSEINKQAIKNDRIINCLLEFHIASEETKFGLDIVEAQQLIESEEFRAFENVNICGVMGMASFSDNTNLVRSEFANLRHIFEALKTKYFIDNPMFINISMGMSSDWTIAVEEGSTIIRVGSMIFGQRNYNL
jgi:pyridoxal phosphate enzyme (YggS family)